MVGVDASPVRAVLRELPRLGAKRGLPRRALRRLVRDEDPGLRDADAGTGTMAHPSGDEMHLNYLLTAITLEAGESVRVMLDAPSNVMLVDDSNLANYTSGKEFEYFGGLAAKSPVDLVAPRPGRWNVLIDTGDADGSVSASVRVVRR